MAATIRGTEPGDGRPRSALTGGRGQVAKDEREYAALAIVLEFIGRVEAGDDRERPVVRHDPECSIGTGGHCGEPEEVKDFCAGEAEAGNRGAIDELEREDSHPDEVGAVDALKTLGEHGAHPEQHRPFGGPVPR